MPDANINSDTSTDTNADTNTDINTDINTNTKAEMGYKAGPMQLVNYAVGLLSAQCEMHDESRRWQLAKRLGCMKKTFATLSSASFYSSEQ